MKKILLLVILVLTLTFSGCEKQDNDYSKEEIDNLIAEMNAQDEIIFNIYKDKTDKLKLQVHELEQIIIELENE